MLNSFDLQFDKFDKRDDMIVLGCLIGVIGFCIAFGVMISKLGREAQVMIDFFNVLSEIVMRMVGVIMW